MRLHEVLGSAADAVVHRIADDVTPAEVERAALAAGWRFAVIESADTTTEHDVLGAFQEGLGLADRFGRDLNALVDALRDLGDDDTPGTLLLWDRPSQFETEQPDGYTAVLDVLAQRAGDERRPRVVVVVRPAPTEG